MYTDFIYINFVYKQMYCVYRKVSGTLKKKPTN